MKNFQRIGLILSDNTSIEVMQVVKRTQVILEENNRTYFEVNNFDYRQSAYPVDILNQLALCDLVIIFGGDGTFLGIARKIHHLRIPILGVNLGRLGFLVDLDQRAVKENLEDILKGRYLKENRFLLSSEIDGERKSVAVNDVVIHKTELSRLIELDVFVDDQYLTSYRSDGLIFSTPTGSTAYALSTGGPIIYPTLSAILIAPICPHTFSHRPIVLSSASEIAVVLSKEMTTSVNVTCDGQELFPFQPNERLNIKRDEAEITLIHPLEYSFFNLLREKLSWGIQPIQGR